MAGQLTIDTLKASTGVLATQNGMTGIAKAWFRFNGTTSPGTIAGAYNVGSVTKNATGNYTINFTTSMVNTNYSAVGCIQLSTSGGRAWCTGPSSLSTGSVTILCGYVDTSLSGLGDSPIICYSIFGA